LRENAIGAIRAGDLALVLNVLSPATDRPPFSLAVADAIAELTRVIIAAEQHRGVIARAERSALCAEAQPYQDVIDRLLYAMAGLTDEEAKGLEARLAHML
jgi:hypothetical protein